jgi:hypothetical protein
MTRKARASEGTAASHPEYAVRRGKMQAIAPKRNEQLAEMWEYIKSDARSIVLSDELAAEAKPLGCKWVMSLLEATRRKIVPVPLDVLAFHLDAIKAHHANPIDWDLGRFTWLYDETGDCLKCCDNVTGRTAAIHPCAVR